MNNKIDLAPTKKNNRCVLGKARGKISVCPQDNPLIKGYTVEEHLKFFDS